MNITLYDAIFGVVPGPCLLLLPNVVMRLSGVAMLAWRRGIKRFRVWPARLIERALTPVQRRSVFGAAPFRVLEILAARCAATFVPDLLTLVPNIATLDLDIVDNNTAAARTPNVLRAVAECLPALRRLTVRFVLDGAVDYDLLMMLTQQRAPAVLELHVSEQDEYLASDTQLGGGGRWAVLLARLPRVEQLWLPLKCTVPGRNALGVADIHCRQLRRVHLHGVGHWHARRVASCDIS